MNFGPAVGLSLVQTAFLSPREDWRSVEYYRFLLDHDCVEWAGEWLRRNPEFLADLRRAPCFSRTDDAWEDGRVRVISCAETCPLARWGLRCCRMNGGDPVFFWLPQCNPQVLAVEAEIAQNAEEAIDIRQCFLLKAVLHVAEQETYLLFSDGDRTLQVVVRGHSTFEQPVLLRCMLHGLREFETKPLTLQRLCCLYRHGRLVKSLYPRERRSHRWIEMLRAWDGIQSGARQRDIACALFGEYAAGDGWSEGYRLRMQRLIRTAGHMVGGGYLKLLL